MGTTTDGQICFGVLTEEDYEFPWDKEPYDGDEIEWWIFEVLKFKPSFEIWDDEGNCINGIQPEHSVLDEYYKERRKFIDSNKKIPIKLVNYCSCDCPMYIVAIPETVIEASRGYPESFDPSRLKYSEESKKELLDFCKQYDIGYDEDPQWYLSSYWG